MVNETYTNASAPSHGGEQRGYVSKIQRFSLHDGDGVRTTVFLKGCNLRCIWCHNPETIPQGIVIQTYFDTKCIGCGECFKICPAGAHALQEGVHVVDREKCIRCGECAKECYAGAIVANGESMPASKVFEEVLKDSEFYKISGGGMTISGGEPMLQKDFVKALLCLAKEQGIHTAIDTAGNVPFSFYEEINDYVDLYLYDIKSIDDAIHREITAVGNERILENIQKLDSIARKIYVRMPIMAGMNDAEALIEKTADLLAPLKSVDHVDILTIHKLASGKYKSLDMDYSKVENAPPISKEQVARYIEIFSSRGITAKEN